MILQYVPAHCAQIGAHGDIILYIYFFFSCIRLIYIFKYTIVGVFFILYSSLVYSLTLVLGIILTKFFSLISEASVMR